MGIQSGPKTGPADADDIVTLNITRVPVTGDLQVDVHYKAGDRGGNLANWEHSAAFKSKIEETYAEVIAAINAAEGLS
jgi:hypothetical protein